MTRSTPGVKQRSRRRRRSRDTRPYGLHLSARRLETQFRPRRRLPCRTATVRRPHGSRSSRCHRLLDSGIHARDSRSSGRRGRPGRQRTGPLFTSDRGCARVSIFACSTETLLGQVTVGAHPNGLAYDRKRRHLYAFNLGEPLGESCTASVVDIDAMRVAAEIPLPGRPRWAAYDSARDLIYANISDPALILRIEPETSAIVGSIGVPTEGPHGLWVDGDRLYCAADGGALVVLGCEGESLPACRSPVLPTS
jgi:hypothetical protein